MEPILETSDLVGLYQKKYIFEIYVRTQFVYKFDN